MTSGTGSNPDVLGALEEYIRAVEAGGELNPEDYVASYGVRVRKNPVSDRLCPNEKCTLHG